MTLEEITKQITDKGITKNERVRILRKTRGQILEEIHSKQQLLDQVDFMIHEIKCRNKK